MVMALVALVGAGFDFLDGLGIPRMLAYTNKNVFVYLSIRNIIKYYDNILYHIII